MTPDSPLPSLRPDRTALLLVDLQNGTCGPEQTRLEAEFPARFRQITLPRLQQLLNASRDAGLEVIHTVIANLTADGRDRSLDYKRCGMGFPPGSPEARVIDELQPAADELVLPKSSSSPFSSTTLDYLLRNMGIYTVKDAADRGYRVICVHDACQAETPERHRAALQCFRGYCRLISVQEFCAAIR